MASRDLKVLIVDDSAAARALLAAAVETVAGQLGRTPVITAVSSGFEALRLLPANPLHLIITDINMPDVHGLELIAFARQHPLHAKTPLLVVTTLSAPRDRDKAMALGADAFCPKPVTIDELGAKITHLLTGARGAERP
ncbi:MAG: response regulator [Deltaproteobacteria bacterium]|nr:response regulator [Deltaproteobacteria bacterium]